MTGLAGLWDSSLGRPERGSIIAIVDVGSNSVRLLVARVLARSAFEVVDEARFDARLGQGLTETGLAEEATERGLRALRVVAGLARSYGPTHLAVVGTEALRRAANAGEFIERAAAETGVRVRVLSGEDEAYAGFLGVVNSTTVQDGHLIDLGGGSLELVRIESRRLASVRSAPLGALYAVERYFRSDPPGAKDVRSLRKAVRAALPREDAAGPLIGTGGAIRNLARMIRLRRRYPLRRLHGLELRRRDVSALARSLSSLDRAGRARLPGIGANRLDTLPAAAIVVDEVMDRIGATSLVVSGQGLREGLVWEVLLGPGAVIPDVRAASVAGLALANGMEPLAAEPVVLAAMSLFEATVSLHGLGAAEAGILVHAARLAGIGMHVDFYDRDRHAEYLVHSGDLHGFSHREIVLLAALVRAADGGTPDVSGYGPVMGQGDGKLLAVLAPLLGAARAVNRRRPSPVHEFVPSVSEGTLWLRLAGGDGLDAEVHALEPQCRRLEQALGVRVVVVPPVVPPYQPRGG